MLPKNKIIILLIIIALMSAVFLVYFFIICPSSKIKAQSENNSPVQNTIQEKNDILAQNGITWGVDFSQFQAKYLELDWKEVYSAIINDLGVKNIKIHTNWKLVEPEKDNYSFDDTDWQIQQAEQNNVKIIYVLGMKTGRWPECHIPAWAKNLSEKDQQSELLKYITEVVSRYKSSNAIVYWQVENEPFLQFGNCPIWYYDNDDFLKQEVALVKSLDYSRQIIISDSGEESNWLSAATVGDIVGTTMYRNAWPEGTDTFNTDSYTFLNPKAYTNKAQVIKKMFNKDVIGIELQAEPWTPIMETSLEQQSETMTPDMFNQDVEFAKQSKLDKIYFWGVEWWYWMKEKQNQPEIWNEAKSLFQNNI